MIARLSIRQSLLVVVLVSIIPAVGIIVGGGINHARSLEDAAAAEAHRLVESIVHLQAQRDEFVFSLLETLASFPAFAEQRVTIEHTVLSELMRTNPDVLNVTVTDANGIVTASPGLAAGTDLSGRQHVRSAITTGRFAVGEFIVAYVDDEPALPYSCPIVGTDGELCGTINMVFPLTNYGAVFDSLALPDGSIMGLTDRNGIRLFFRPPLATNPVGERIKAAMWEAISTGPDTGTVRGSGSDGVKRTYAYRMIRSEFSGDARFYVVLGIPESQTIGVATRALVRSLVWMVGIIAIAVAVATGLGGLVIGSRFAHLAGAAERIAAGDLAARTGLVTDHTEIGRVAGSIDTMAERIEERDRLRREEHERLEASLREKDVLLQEVHHRVKNNMLLISSIVSLQRSQASSLDEFASNLQSRIRAISSVHELLYRAPDLASIHIRDLLQELTVGVSQSPGAGRIVVTGDDPVVEMERAIPLALVVNELLVNAVKHAPPDRRTNVEVALRDGADRLDCIVTDTGDGFPAGFDPTMGTSLGMRLVVALASQLGADLDVGNSEAGGGRVILRIPAAGRAPA